MDTNSKPNPAFGFKPAVTVIIAVATLAIGALSPTDATASARKFFAPDYLGQPVAFCFEGERGCGKPAATVWCQRNGYKKALSYARRSLSAGTELRFVDTGNICKSGNCITFSQIQCM